MTPIQRSTQAHLLGDWQTRWLAESTERLRFFLQAPNDMVTCSVLTSIHNFCDHVANSSWWQQNSSLPRAEISGAKITSRPSIFRGTEKFRSRAGNWTDTAWEIPGAPVLESKHCRSRDRFQHSHPDTPRVGVYDATVGVHRHPSTMPFKDKRKYPAYKLQISRPRGIRDPRPPRSRM